MTTPASIPPEVAARIDAFVVAHRRIAPGALAGVVVTGSVALGDWHEGGSDVDLVLLVGRALERAERGELAALHAAQQPWIDGVYLTPAQLAAGPDALESAPQVVEGVWNDAAPGGELTWITWREVELGVEGAASDDGIRSWSASRHRFPGADAGVRAFSRANLQQYWLPLGRATKARLAGRAEAGPVDSAAIQWIGFGPARLVATAETGAILSKSAAADFAAARWPEHAGLLARLAAARAGAAESFIVADARQAVRLLDRCVEAARTA